MSDCCVSQNSYGVVEMDICECGWTVGVEEA
jgi:hypothetical protein